MASLLVCESELIIQPGQAPQCSAWASYDVVVFGANAGVMPEPASLVTAFGAGLIVLGTLYGALWAIRAVKSAIRSS